MSGREADPLYLSSTTDSNRHPHRTEKSRELERDIWGQIPAPPLLCDLRQVTAPLRALAFIPLRKMRKVPLQELRDQPMDALGTQKVPRKDLSNQILPLVFQRQAPAPSKTGKSHGLFLRKGGCKRKELSVPFTGRSLRTFV